VHTTRQARTSHHVSTMYKVCEMSTRQINNDDQCPALLYPGNITNIITNSEVWPRIQFYQTKSTLTASLPQHFCSV